MSLSKVFLPMLLLFLSQSCPILARPANCRENSPPSAVAYLSRSSKAGKYADSFSSITPEHSDTSSKNIAIIGGGIGGALLARNLVEIAKKLDTSIKLTVFEKELSLGGGLRSHDSRFTAEPIELGSQYLPSGTELNDIADELGLTLAPATAEADFGIWNSDENNYVYEEKTWQPDWWKALHRRICWGTAPAFATALLERTQRALSSMPRETFEDTIFLERALGREPPKEYMSHFNVTGPFVDEYVASAARARYSQKLSEIDGLAATLSLKEDAGFRIRQGNQALVEGIARSSGASLRTGTEIKTVKSLTDLGTYKLTYNIPNMGFTVDETFDMVIIAAPIGPSNITFEPPLKYWHTPEARTYVPQHITHLMTTREVSGPGHVNVMGSSAPFNSMRLVQRFPGDYFIYRLTSSTSLHKSIINQFFDPKTVKWIHRYEWNAGLPSQKSDVALSTGIPFDLEEGAGGLFYTGGLGLFGGGIDQTLHWSKMFATVAACRKLGGSCDGLPHGQKALNSKSESAESMDL